MGVELRLVRYAPSSRRRPYDELMNGAGMQQDLLRRARAIAAASGLEGTSCDVRPGAHRAHARVNAPLADYTAESGFAARQHNAKVVDALQANLGAGG